MRGLLEAAIDFNDSLNVKFGTYASMRITWAFTRAWRRDMRVRRGYGVLKVSIDAEGEDGRELVERVSTGEKTPLDMAEIESDLEIVLPRINSLTKNEKRVIELRFGLIDGRQMTLSEVAGVVGLTSERVRQIEAKALERLRCSYLGIPFLWDSGRNKPR